MVFSSTSLEGFFFVLFPWCSHKWNSKALSLWLYSGFTTRGKCFVYNWINHTWSRSRKSFQIRFSFNIEILKRLKWSGWKWGCLKLNRSLKLNINWFTSAWHFHKLFLCCKSLIFDVNIYKHSKDKVSCGFLLNILHILYIAMDTF